VSADETVQNSKQLAELNAKLLKAEREKVEEEDRKKMLK
jgi:hypothetical protein